MPADANTSCTLFPALRLLPAEPLAIVMLQEPVQNKTRKLIALRKASLSVAGKGYTLTHGLPSLAFIVEAADATCFLQISR